MKTHRAHEPVRPRIMDYLEAQDGPRTVAEIARGAQVSRPSARTVLRELGAAGRIDITGPGGSLGYQLRPAGTGTTLVRKAELLGQHTRRTAAKLRLAGMPGLGGDLDDLAGLFDELAGKLAALGEADGNLYGRKEHR